MKTRHNLKAAGFLLILGLVASCGPKDEPMPALPSYLRVPTTLEGYKGSGKISITGNGLSLLAEGPEQLNAQNNTYSGVLGDISGEDLTARFTVGQPRPYSEYVQVPREYRAYGDLLIMNTITPGTYQMGLRGVRGPRGELADLLMTLPGPQTYYAETGTLTISESTQIKNDGRYALYRVTGSFQATMIADGIGITQRNPPLSGTFDLLLVSPL